MQADQREEQRRDAANSAMLRFIHVPASDSQAFLCARVTRPLIDTDSHDEVGLHIIFSFGRSRCLKQLRFVASIVDVALQEREAYV